MTRSVFALFTSVVLMLSSPVAALAQSSPAPAEAKPRPNPYGSPLDTLMSTRLWTDVPPAQDFVKETRPDAKSLDYAPLTGQDPTRPTPRDPAGVAALQAELESSGAANEKRAQGLRDPVKSPAKPAAARHARKGVPKKTTSAAAD